jgi:hypothetical protein
MDLQKKGQLKKALAGANVGELLLERYIIGIEGTDCSGGCQSGCSQCCSSGTANRQS